MKLNEITSIRQTSTEKEVNEYLAKGYRIIKIFSTKVTTDSGEFVQPTYVLGLGKEE
tara:strand:- start:1485 stop:1655 length:171 start_codon:yes stop_codon:yes gene_type:complete